MKKILSLLAAALLAALPFQTVRAAVPDPASASRETRDYQLRGFDGLDISWTFKVELTRGSRYSVRVEAPDFIFPYLKVEVKGGVLTLGTREQPKDIRRKIEALSRSGEIHASVTMPELCSLEMSGAAQLNTRDEFQHRNDKFRIIHCSCPLTERNSSAAHFSTASIVSASTRSRKVLVLVVLSFSLAIVHLLFFDFTFAIISSVSSSVAQLR